MMIGPNDMPTRPITDHERTVYQFEWPHARNPMVEPLRQEIRKTRKYVAEQDRHFWRCIRFVAWCYLQVVLIAVLINATGISTAYRKPAPASPIVRPA